MKHSVSKLKVAVACSAVALFILPSVGWSTRPLGVPVSGQITALPGGHEIEVGNHMYRIKKDSSAEKQVLNLAPGQQVHLLLDGAADSATAEVVAITVDAEPGE